jgi:hypothetical protein
MIFGIAQVLHVSEFEGTPMTSTRGYRFFPPLPGRFLHGVDLDDPYPCWNLALAGRVWSPDFLASMDPALAASHRPIRDASLEELRANGLPVGIPTPRAAWQVGAAATVRSGGRVGMGQTNTQWYSPEDAARLRELGDVELAFEAGRREICPEAPSRLSSLYLAEDSDAGRAHIRTMLGRNVHIMRVIVPSVARACRVDTGWFESYCREPNPKLIESYWRGVPIDPCVSTWEILIDGAIQVDDPVALEYLKAHGAHRDRGGVFQKTVAPH